MHSAEDVAGSSEHPDDVEPARGAAGRTRRPWRIEPITSVAVLAGLLVVLGIHLGPALVGLKTFSGMDLLATLAPWSDGGASGSVTNGYVGDSIDTLLPAYLQMHERLMAGEWPLWTALSGPGAELLASTNYSALSLSTMWFLILPTSYAVGVVKLAEIVLAMGGMYLWLRRIGLGRTAGLLAGVVYCGSGFVVGWSTWAPQSSVAAMMPALFWAIERLLALRTARSALPLAVVVALLMLGGFPAVAGHALYAGGAYFLVRLLADRRAHATGSTVGTLLGGGGAVVLGAALAAIQLLPLALSLSDTDLSSRSGQFFQELSSRSLLSMFFPQSMFEIGYGDSNLIEGYAFLGIGAVSLALIAVFTRRPRDHARGVVPFLALGFALAAAVVWKQGWWTAWMADLPVFYGNNSGRVRDLVFLFGSALAGIGLQRIITSEAAMRRRMAIIAGVCLVAFSGLAVGVWARIPEASGKLLLVDAVPGLAIIAVCIAAVVWARHIVVRTVAVAVVALLAAVQLNGSVANYWPLSDLEDFYPERAVISALDEAMGDGRVATAGTLLGSTSSVYGIRSVTAHTFQPSTWREYLEALELGAFTEGQTPTNPSLVFPEEETPAQAALLDRLSVTTWLTVSGLEIPGPLTDADGQAWAETEAGGSMDVAAGQSWEVPLGVSGVRGVVLPFSAEVTAEGQDVSVRVEVVDADDEVLASGELVRPSLGAGEWSVAIAGEELDASAGELSLRVTVDVPTQIALDAEGAPDVGVIGTQDDGRALVYSDANGVVWQREGALPRIRWAGRSEVVADAEARLQRLADPALGEDVVILDAAGPAGEGTEATLEVIEDEGDLIQVAVDAAGGGYLVVADSMQRGWVVTIDGEEAELVDADHAFAGVYVPAGEHEVSFTYRGSGVGAGLVISAAAAAVIIGVLVFTAFRNRRRRGVLAAAPPVTGAGGDPASA
ncbi:MAG: YfhO family protein [Microbacterium sp.]